MWFSATIFQYLFDADDAEGPYQPQFDDVAAGELR